MNNERRDELSFLENVTHTYGPRESPQVRIIKSLAVRTFAPYLQPTADALELGCSDGYMTALIASLVKQLTVVDGSVTFIEMAKAKELRNVNFYHSLFEDYQADKPFDCIFACWVLEHVIDPVDLLKKVATLLKPDGVLCIVVPNARAMSRQLARHMGLLDDLYALTPNDVRHGHRRVYDRTLFNRDLAKAGLKQLAQGGLMLKPFADFQMDALFHHEILSEAQVEGLYRMGLEFPEFSGSLFSVCQRA